MKNWLYFGAGIAVGALPCFFIAKRKYEKIANEEIESVKEKFCCPKQTVKKEETEEEPAKQGYTYDAYVKLAKTYDSDLFVPEQKSDAPYVITPKEFMENKMNYEKEYFDYYEEDKILTDSRSNHIEDISNTIGYDALNSFGLYEAHVVHVRNDKMGSIYEVFSQEQSYDESIGESDTVD